MKTVVITGRLREFYASVNRKPMKFTVREEDCESNKEKEYYLKFIDVKYYDSTKNDCKFTAVLESNCEDKHYIKEFLKCFMVKIKDII